jgi:hypothetical protein
VGRGDAGDRGMKVPSPYGPRVAAPLAGRQGAGPGGRLHDHGAPGEARDQSVADQEAVGL